MIGICRPSSYTSRASAESTCPPMSAVWQVEAKKAMHISPRKIGEQIVTSLRWPDVSQGSFVIKTSPGWSVSTGHAARKCFIASAMELMCPGAPVRPDHRGRLALLDYRGPGQRHLRRESIAVIHGSLDEASSLREVRSACSLDRAYGATPRLSQATPGQSRPHGPRSNSTAWLRTPDQSDFWVRPGDLHAPVQRLDRHALWQAVIDGAIRRLEARRDHREAFGGEVPERHRDRK